MPASRKPSEKLGGEELKLLHSILAEIEARGLSVPEEYLNEKKKVYNWHTDSSGYFTALDGRLYNPTANQKGFCQSNSRFVAYIGSRGSGKSAAGAQKAIAKIKTGQSGAVLNPDFENFKTSTWPELRQWLPWEMVVPSQRYRKNEEWEPHKPFRMVFMNSTFMICKGLKDPDSARGPNINWLWYDEATRDIDGMGWKLAVASVRIGTDPQAWITATPRGKNHWTYEFFEEQRIPPEALAIFQAMNRPVVEIYYGSIEDNKQNLDPGYYASMIASYPAGWLRAQEIEGKFVDEGGILGNPAWFYGKTLAAAPEQVKARVRYWDLAASEKKISGKKGDDPDESVGTLMSWDGEHFFIEDQVAFYGDWKKIKEMIILTAGYDGTGVPIYIEQEPGGGGKNQIAEIASLSEMKYYTVRAYLPRESGDKIMRANVWFADAALGNMFLIEGTWIEGFLRQLSSFPLARHDDRVDSVSGARLCVAPVRKWSKTPFLAVGGKPKEQLMVRL